MAPGAWRFYDAGGHALTTLARKDYAYDPRVRPWYVSAREAGGASVMTEPYVFFTSRMRGLTLARLASTGAVVGMDTTLSDLGAELANLKLTEGTRVALTTSTGLLIAHSADAAAPASGASTALADLASLRDPVLDATWALASASIVREQGHVSGRDWELVSIPLMVPGSVLPYRILIAVPDDELFSQARSLLLRQWLLICVLVVLCVPAVYWLTQRIVRPLRELADETRRVSRFDFRPTPERRSRIAEVDMLRSATGQMRATISRFLQVNAALNSEQRLEPLLEVVLRDLLANTGAGAGAIYLSEAGSSRLQRSFCVARRGAETWPEALDGAGDAVDPVLRAARQHETVIARAGERAEIAVPLQTLERDLVGVLVLELPAQVDAFELRRDDPLLAFIEALSSSAALAIETRRLIEAQRALLDAVIRLLAGAIDAKSPYTGGHCQRVPVITRMLAEAVSATEEGPLKDFRLDATQREAIHIAAWLHDCGKITTPEFVVDKATKLETLYNRIHEIRMRFEVLKRDAEIAFWRAHAGAPGAEAEAALAQTLDELDAEFAFVAACNQGGETLDEASVARLEEIGARRWQRTLDDRLGLSRDEVLRLAHVAPRSLPAEERLLADKPEHIEARSPAEMLPPDNRWGFRMDVPAHRFNRGELHNLQVARGTLTEEERYIINAHIVQTIMMLERLPFPRALRSVPEIAGGHHEKMDGSGYPRRLRGEQMSVPARIMALADVFEALTAADRPYKPAKTLSESLAIMARMTREGHLDPELFRIFLRSGVYLEYARAELRPEQIDAVDIDALLA